MVPALLVLLGSAQGGPGDLLAVKEWSGSFSVAYEGKLGKGENVRYLHSASVHLPRVDRGLVLPQRLDPGSGEARTWSGRRALETHASIDDVDRHGPLAGTGTERRIHGAGPAPHPFDSPALAVDLKKKVYHVVLPPPALAFQNLPVKVVERSWRTDRNGKREEKSDSYDAPFPGLPDLGSGNPVEAAGIVYDRPLPAGVGPLEDEVRFPLAGSDGQAHLVLRWSFSPGPPVPVELVLEPPADYDDWRPKGGEAESDPAGRIEVTARLQDRGGGPPSLRRSTSSSSPARTAPAR